MKFVLCFSTTTAGYRCHAITCKAATDSARYHLMPETFETVDAARACANDDESQKAGEPTRADFKACACCRK